MQLKEEPLVSVLMTSFNREKYIAEAIQSVLESTYKYLELIIVDDCSTDDTVNIAKKFVESDPRVLLYVNEQNLGDYRNRNKAASYAKGKYLKYLDSDDLLYQHGLEVFVKSMQYYPEAALGLSSRAIQQTNPFPILYTPEQSYRNHFFKNGFLNCGPTGVIIRRDVFMLLGGFSGKRMIGDFELWLKISAQFPVIVVAPALVFWRIHDGQEFFAGIENGVYLEMNLPVIEASLASADCKLDDKEKVKIINYYRRVSAWGLLHLVKKGKFGNAKQIQAKLKLNFADFLRSFFRKNKLSSYFL